MRNGSFWSAILCALALIAVPQIGWSRGREPRPGEFRPVALSLENGEEIVSVVVGRDVAFGQLVAYANQGRTPELPAITVDDIVRLNPTHIRYVCGRTAHTPRIASRHPARWDLCADAPQEYGHALDGLTYRIPRQHIQSLGERITSLEQSVAERDQAAAERQASERIEAETRRSAEQTRGEQVRLASERTRSEIAVRDVRIVSLEARLQRIRAHQDRTIAFGLAGGMLAFLLFVLAWRGRFLHRQARILRENDILLDNAQKAVGLKDGAYQLQIRELTTRAEAHQNALAMIEADAEAKILSERETLKVEHAKALEKLRAQARREALLEAQAAEQALTENGRLRTQIEEAGRKRTTLREACECYDRLILDLAKVEREMVGYQELIDRRQDLPDTAAEMAQLRVLLGKTDQKQFDLQLKIQEVSQVLAEDFEAITGLPFTERSLHQKLDEQMKDLIRVRADAEAARDIYEMLNQNRKQHLTKLTQETYELKKANESLRAEKGILEERLQTIDDSNSMLWHLDAKDSTLKNIWQNPSSTDSISPVEKALGAVIYKLLQELQKDTFFQMERSTQVDIVHLMAHKEVSCCECNEQVLLKHLHGHFVRIHEGIPARTRRPTIGPPPGSGD